MKKETDMLQQIQDAFYPAAMSGDRSAAEVILKAIAIRNKSDQLSIKARGRRRFGDTSERYDHTGSYDDNESKPKVDSKALLLRMLGRSEEEIKAIVSEDAEGTSQ